MALQDGWCAKQLETDRPGIDDLTRTLGNPPDGWMNTTMPTQVHDVLLAHGWSRPPEYRQERRGLRTGTTRFFRTAVRTGSRPRR